MIIPAAVRTTVLRRFASLERLDRSILMRASVVGRRFDVPLLVATASCREVRVRAALERACELQLIVALASAGEGYAFRHALTRDIIYAELLDSRLRPVHRRIVRALERMVRRDDIALEDLAYHGWAAGDARRALRYNELAGDRAAAVHALVDARSYYVRAQSLIEIDSAAYARLAAKLRAMSDGAPDTR